MASVEQPETAGAANRRLTPRGEQRRNELLDYATHRFADAGYHPTSVAELCDGLGVGKGVFYWYFDSKEQLFIEILREGQRALRTAQQAAISEEPNPIRRLEIGIRSSLHWWAEHRELYLLIQFATTEATFRPAIRKGEKTAVKDVERHVVEAIETGLIADRDPEIVAQAILGVTSTLARTQLIGLGRDADEIADDVIDFCLHGVTGHAKDAAPA